MRVSAISACVDAGVGLPSALMRLGRRRADLGQAVTRGVIHLPLGIGQSRGQSRNDGAGRALQGLWRKHCAASEAAWRTSLEPGSRRALARYGSPPDRRSRRWSAWPASGRPRRATSAPLQRREARHADADQRHRQLTGGAGNCSQSASRPSWRPRPEPRTACRSSGRWREAEPPEQP